jgi:hypothetical protein
MDLCNELLTQDTGDSWGLRSSSLWRCALRASVGKTIDSEIAPGHRLLQRTCWSPTSANGTPLGRYSIAVQAVEVATD